MIIVAKKLVYTQRSNLIHACKSDAVAHFNRKHKLVPSFCAEMPPSRYDWYGRLWLNHIAEITAQLLSLSYVYLISSDDSAIIMIFLCRLTSWKGAGYVVLTGSVSVTISYSFRCLTTETVKYTNENSFIENLASSKYSMWAKIRKQM